MPSFRPSGSEPAALKPFEPVVPVERFEPFPLAAWQAWPRLDWTPPEKPAALDAHAGNGNGNGNGHHHAPVPETPIVEDFDQVAEFEEALEAEESLEPFEPVVPAERVEPMPMAAWHVWPRLEGVAAEAYQEPIAPRKAAAKPEWVELMRSLREDIARRRAELAASGPVAPPPQKPQRPKAAETRVKAARPASRRTRARDLSGARASPAPERCRLTRRSRARSERVPSRTSGACSIRNSAASRRCSTSSTRSPSRRRARAARNDRLARAVCYDAPVRARGIRALLVLLSLILLFSGVPRAQQQAAVASRHPKRISASGWAPTGTSRRRTR